MRTKWELYDRLIDGIPQNVLVEDYVVGAIWTLVRAGGVDGVALTVRQNAGSADEQQPIIGQPLRKIAALVKSWDFTEASIGMAAINAWYNTPQRAAERNLLHPGAEGNDNGDAFRVFGSAVEGKRVAVIGHFPYLERKLADICQLSILEREPQKGDYPDSACEYILPEQDYVFITGMTLTNKTLPRLLELCQNASVCMVGPSAPLADVLFDYGVDCISGFCATNPERTAEALRRGVRQKLFEAGQRVNYFKQEN